MHYRLLYVDVWTAPTELGQIIDLELEDTMKFPGRKDMAYGAWAATRILDPTFNILYGGQYQPALRDPVSVLSVLLNIHPANTAIIRCTMQIIGCLWRRNTTSSGTLSPRSSGRIRQTREMGLISPLGTHLPTLSNLNAVSMIDSWDQREVALDQEASAGHDRRT